MTFTSCESFAEWVLCTHKCTEQLPQSIYWSLAEDEYLRFLSASKKKYVQWWLQIGSQCEQRILIELDFALCPKTCENFWQLSNGYRDLGYKHSKLHRIVKQGYIEGGFLESTGTLVNSSIYGAFFADENYAYAHDVPGVLGMSSAGKHLNGSVFYITLRPLPHLNGRSVAFGRVVEGFEVLRTLESALKVEHQVPLECCAVVRCENYLSVLTPMASDGSRPRSQKEQVQSKLEGADIETLLLRRQAILREIDSTREELEQQRRLREVLAEVISEING